MQNLLRTRQSLIKKYSFEEYDPIYHELFKKEQQRILTILADIKINIYHIGSTAIPGVGGKGVIDIAITSNLADHKQITARLLKLGYEFRKSGGDKNRKFHQREFKGRRYHVHLSEFKNINAQRAIAFRDFLRNNPQLAKEYSDIKKQAAKQALKMSTKDEMKLVYAQVKAPVIDKIQVQLDGYIKKCGSVYQDI
jgi:GrpB-like predicted nucleotidyltransferase (UPF0157 family)